MSLEELEKYLRAKGAFTVAEVQKKFSLGYAEVRQAFQELENAGKIYLESGVTFKCVVTEPQAQAVGDDTRDAIIKKRREELMERLANMSKESEEVNFDDLEDDEDDDDFDLDELFKWSDEQEEDDDDEDTDTALEEIKKRRQQLEDHFDSITGKKAPLSKKTLTTAELAESITKRLKELGIKVELAQTFIGASVTRYIFNILSPKATLSGIQKYTDEIRACTQGTNPVRITHAGAGNRQVAVEVANEKREIVALDSILKSDTFFKANGKLDFVLGEDITRKEIVVDLVEMPHLLIAGSTGSGKSNVLCSMILSIAQKYSPDYVRFLMIDPKFVELSQFNGLPHMLTHETVTNITDSLAAMDYLINEMENRYTLMRQSESWNIVEYNRKFKDKMPYIIFVVDELADIMSEKKIEFETKLQRLAQKCRAAGIHIVLATQRPDVKTITGTVKANLPSRIALKLWSVFDSNTVLGCADAEKLVCPGDMLFFGGYVSSPERLQGAYVSSEDLRNIVAQLKKKYPSKFDESVKDKIFVYWKQQETPKAQDINIEVDPLCKKALRYWLEKQGGRASIASLQRNLGIGFNRSGRIMDTLQKMGYVEELSETDSSIKPLRVLVQLEDLDKLFPDLPD